MAICAYCGHQYDDGANFCPNCGHRVAPEENGREAVYEGSVHKCPNCGEVLPSFVAYCPACGYEIRGNSATKSVKELYSEITKAETNEQKGSLIRNFPIPNTKEDILEFMVIASSNILGEDDQDIYDAWLAKFEQAYQKAVLLFKSDDDFSKIRRIYVNCQNNIDTEKKRRLNKFTINTVIRNITVAIGLVVLIGAIAVDRSGGNCTMVELAGCVLLIASASSLFKRGAAFIDYVICGISGLLMFALANLLDNGSFTELCAFVVLIIVAVNYFKSLRGPYKEE